MRIENSLKPNKENPRSNIMKPLRNKIPVFLGLRNAFIANALSILVLNLNKTDYRGCRVLGGYGKRVNFRTSVSLPPVLFLTTEKRYEEVDNDRFCYSLRCTCSIC